MQEDVAVVRKEMSLRRTFCLQFAIVILVQQRIFVCAVDCNCRCNQRLICDEIERAATADDSHDAQWRRWDASLLYLEQLRTHFDAEYWTGEIISVQNKMKSIDVLEERLDEAETRATRLENALENSREEFENKMAAFEQKLQDVQNQAMMLDRNVDETEKKIKVQEEILLNISATISEAELKYEELKEDFKLFYAEGYLKSLIEEEKKSRERSKEELSLNISATISEVALKYEELKEDINLKLFDIEGDFKSSIEKEKRSRERSEEELRLNISAMFSEVELKYGELKEGFDLKLSNIEGYLKSSKEEEIGWMKRFEDKMRNDMVLAFRMKDSEFLEAVSDLEERLEIVRNQTDNFELAIKEEKEAREELKRKFEELQRNYETFASGEDKSRRRRALERPLTKVRKHPSTVEDKA